MNEREVLQRLADCIERACKAGDNLGHDALHTLWQEVASEAANPALDAKSPTLPARPEGESAQPPSSAEGEVPSDAWDPDVDGPVSRIDMYDELQEYAAAARTEFSKERSKRMIHAQMSIRRKIRAVVRASRAPAGAVDVERLLRCYYGPNGWDLSSESCRAMQAREMTKALSAQGVRTTAAKGATSDG